MIALLVNWGFSRMWAWIAAIGVPILIIVGLYLAVDAWGDSRYRSGKADEKATWIAASDKLLRDAAGAATAADKISAAAAVDFAARQEDERNRIDAAIANGTSPVDALFPSAAGNGVQAP
jgi:hypothetical protein